MTPLKALILAELLQRGPMRDVELWQHSNVRDRQTVTLECISLEDEGYIEQPRGVRPVSFKWQLTEKGKAVAANFSGGATCLNISNKR
jgi:DNA-binding HxlR family transcriptional regulator